MAKNKKSKEVIDYDKLDLDFLLKETVTTSRLGRALASLGATLTGREKHDAQLVYHVLKLGRPYSNKLPVIASISKIPELKKYTPSEAIKWFAQRYSKEAEPLLKKLQEEYTKEETSLNYGLREKKDLPDKFYIASLSNLLDISEDRARILYHGVIKPHLEKEEEKSRLVSVVMKETKNK